MLPGPSSGDLEFERPGQERTDCHDDGEHAHAGEGGCSGDGADDVASDEKFEAQQNRATNHAARRAVGRCSSCWIEVGAWGRDEESEERAEHDNHDADGIDRFTGVTHPRGVVHGKSLRDVVNGRKQGEQGQPKARPFGDNRTTCIVRLSRHGRR